jgi:hypothetical protein
LRRHYTQKDHAKYPSTAVLIAATGEKGGNRQLPIGKIYPSSKNENNQSVGL